MTALIAALGAGAATALMVRHPLGALKRLKSEPHDHERIVHSRWRLMLLGALALAGMAGLGLLTGARGVTWGLVAMVVGITGLILLRRQRQRALRRQRREEVVRAGDVLAGLLRIGQVPATALVVAAAESPVLAEAAALQSYGGDPGQTLLDAAQQPGFEGLAELGRAWRVAQRTGASLADSIAAVSTQLAVNQQVQRAVAAELAAPRASGRLMAILPLAGLVVGYSTGGDPLQFLTSSIVGQICLVLGVGLACLGVLWTDSIAERSGGGL